MEEGRKNFWIFGFPPLMWMMIIFGLSSVPGKYVPKGVLIHQMAHFVEYAVFGVLLARGFAHLKKRLGVLELSILSVVLAVVFAFFDEWRQSFVPGRMCNFGTVIFDTVYAILGVSIYDEVALILSHKKRKNSL